MWIMLNDAFFSIVSKGCARDELLVRARRRGDIEKLFADVKVEKTPGADYLFRAVVKRHEVGEVLVGEVQRINYGNFKDSVDDPALHGAYLRVWSSMAAIQPSAPYGGRGLFTDFAGNPTGPIMPKKRARKLRGKGR